MLINHRNAGIICAIKSKDIYFDFSCDNTTMMLILSILNINIVTSTKTMISIRTILIPVIISIGFTVQ